MEVFAVKPGSGDLLNEYFLAYRFAPDHPALTDHLTDERKQ